MAETAGIGTNRGNGKRRKRLRGIRTFAHTVVKTAQLCTFLSLQNRETGARTSGMGGVTRAGGWQHRGGGAHTTRGTHNPGYTPTPHRCTPLSTPTPGGGSTREGGCTRVANPTVYYPGLHPHPGLHPCTARLRHPQCPVPQERPVGLSCQGCCGPGGPHEPPRPRSAHLKAESGNRKSRTRGNPESQKNQKGRTRKVKSRLRKNAAVTGFAKPIPRVRTVRGFYTFCQPRG